MRNTCGGCGPLIFMPAWFRLTLGGVGMDKKFIGLLTVMVLVCAALLIAANYSLRPAADNSPAAVVEPISSPGYIEKVFVADQVTDIHIDLAPADFADMMQNPTAEEYKEAAITVNGQTVEHVGFRVKGNSSLNSVARSDSRRFSFKVDFDQYIDGQNLFGLTKLNLNNSFSDPSFMREYLSYSLLKEMDLPTPAYSYVNLYVNGELIGLYLAVEGIEEPFLQRYYGKAIGNLYKPEGAGSDLVYVDDKMSSYSGIAAVINKKNGADEALLAMLKALNQGQNLEVYLDVDEILRYFAVNTVLVNMDSYQGSLKHNYYLYEQNGVFSILPWDYNMSFGGFGMGMQAGQGPTSLYIDTPLAGTTLEQRPLLGKLLEVPEYKARYHQYIEEFVAGPFAAERMEAEIKRVADMIRPYLEQDPTKFTTMEQFELAIAEGAENGPAPAPGAANDREVFRTDTAFSGAANAFQNSGAISPGDGQKAAGLENAIRMTGKGRDGMMQEVSSMGLMKFVKDRIENVNQQLSGTLPAAGDTQNQGWGMMGSPPPGANFEAQWPAGERPRPPERMRLRQPNMQAEPPGMNQPGPGLIPGPGFPGQVRSIPRSQLYILGGALLLILLAVLLISRRKTRYTV